MFFVFYMTLQKLVLCQKHFVLSKLCYTAILRQTDIWIKYILFVHISNISTSLSALWLNFKWKCIYNVIAARTVPLIQAERVNLLMWQYQSLSSLFVSLNLSKFHKVFGYKSSNLFFSIFCNLEFSWRLLQLVELIWRL